MRLEIPQFDPNLWLRLNIEAKHRGLDVSELMIEALQHFLGIDKAGKLAQTESNLDRLAGTWSKEEGEEFDRNTKPFGEIDMNLWE